MSWICSPDEYSRAIKSYDNHDQTNIQFVVWLYLGLFILFVLRINVPVNRFSVKIFVMLGHSPSGKHVGAINTLLNPTFI